MLGVLLILTVALAAAGSIWMLRGRMVDQAVQRLGKRIIAFLRDAVG